MTRGERGGDYGKKGERFAGTIMGDTWTITRGDGNRGGRWGGLSGVVRRGGGKRQVTVLEQQ